MKVYNQHPLKKYNTFGLDVKANCFIEINSTEDIVGFLKKNKPNKPEILILGGGSNVLFTKDYHGTVLKMNIKGIENIYEDEESILLQTGAGEIWHDFVIYSINNNWGGVENLSLIPGSVGAAPIQNIGAYGVEQKEVFESLEAIHIETLSIRKFTKEDCQFGYRNSIFKNSEKGNYIILSVTYKLQKKPIINISYGAITEILQKNKIKNITIKDVSKAVCEIRRSKLPDPKKIGNSGSFFKNPEIPTHKFEQLKNNFPQIVGYSVSKDITKVPAGWLIEQCGWKGKRFGDIGVHKNQSLVLVNYGGGKGEEIKKLSEKIQASVEAKFNIILIPEVNIL